jgi:hypothetical protein
MLTAALIIPDFDSGNGVVMRELFDLCWSVCHVLANYFGQLYRKNQTLSKKARCRVNTTGNRVVETCYPEENSLYVKRSPTQNYFGTSI